MAAPWEEELDLQCVATEQLMGRAAAVACAPQGAEKWFFLFLSFLSPGPVSIAIIQSNNPIFLPPAVLWFCEHPAPPQAQEGQGTSAPPAWVTSQGLPISPSRACSGAPCQCCLCHLSLWGEASWDTAEPGPEPQLQLPGVSPQPVLAFPCSPHPSSGAGVCGGAAAWCPSLS
jgi:hypothetical protein